MAFDYYIRAKQYYIRDKENQSKNALVDRIIARRYYKSGFYQESLEIYDKLLAFYTDKNDESQQARILFEISNVYGKKGDPELSLNFLNKSIALNKQLKDTSLLIDYTLNRVDRYANLNEPDSALISAAEAFKLASKIGNRDLLTKSLYYIGKVNLQRNDLEKAIRYLANSEILMPNYPYSEDRREVYDLLSKAYAKDNKFEKAYAFGQKYTELNDSILNQDRIKIINDLAIKNQVTEKNKDIANLEVEKKSIQSKTIIQRNALYFVAAGFFLLLMALYYLIRFYTQKIKTEKIINEQQHEIDQRKIRELEDNIKISNMQSMIVGQEKERERIAKDLHDSLGGLLSSVKLQFDSVRQKLLSPPAVTQFEKATIMLDDAVEEVRVIARNLQPGALKDLGLIPALNDLINRFEGDTYPEIYFQHFDLPEKIDEMISLNVYRIIQELLTNSIKHAKAKEILIQLNSDDNELFIQYEDDGQGFIADQNKRQGMGLENIKSRINYLKGNISIESKTNEGVSFLIKVPLTKETDHVESQLPSSL